MEGSPLDRKEGRGHSEGVGRLIDLWVEARGSSLLDAPAFPVE